MDWFINDGNNLIFMLKLCKIHGNIPKVNNPNNRFKSQDKLKNRVLENLQTNNHALDKSSTDDSKKTISSKQSKKYLKKKRRTISSITSEIEQKIEKKLQRSIEKAPSKKEMLSISSRSYRKPNLISGSFEKFRSSQVDDLIRFTTKLQIKPTLNSYLGKSNVADIFLPPYRRWEMLKATCRIDSIVDDIIDEYMNFVSIKYAIRYIREISLLHYQNELTELGYFDCFPFTFQKENKFFGLNRMDNPEYNMKEEKRQLAKMRHVIKLTEEDILMQYMVRGRVVNRIMRDKLQKRIFNSLDFRVTGIDPLLCKWRIPNKYIKPVDYESQKIPNSIPKSLLNPIGRFFNISTYMPMPQKAECDVHGMMKIPVVLSKHIEYGNLQVIKLYKMDSYILTNEITMENHYNYANVTKMSIHTSQEQIEIENMDELVYENDTMVGNEKVVTTSLTGNVGMNCMRRFDGDTPSIFHIYLPSETLEPDEESRSDIQEPATSCALIKYKSKQSFRKQCLETPILNFDDSLMEDFKKFMISKGRTSPFTSNDSLAIITIDKNTPDRSRRKWQDSETMTEKCSESKESARPKLKRWMQKRSSSINQVKKNIKKEFQENLKSVEKDPLLQIHKSSNDHSQKSHCSSKRLRSLDSNKRKVSSSDQKTTVSDDFTSLQSLKDLNPNIFARCFFKDPTPDFRRFNNKKPKAYIRKKSKKTASKIIDNQEMKRLSNKKHIRSFNFEIDNYDTILKLKSPKSKNQEYLNFFPFVYNHQAPVQFSPGKKKRPQTKKFVNRKPIVMSAM